MWHISIFFRFWNIDMSTANVLEKSGLNVTIIHNGSNIISHPCSSVLTMSWHMTTDVELSITEYHINTQKHFTFKIPGLGCPVYTEFLLNGSFVIYHSQLHHLNSKCSGTCLFTSIEPQEEHHSSIKILFSLNTKN